MSPEQPTDNLSAFFRDSIFILNASVQHYRAGEKAYYRVAALQLRLLLCDTVRRHNRLEDISLLPKIIPDCTLPPLSPDGVPVQGDPLPLAAWLKQPLYGSGGDCISIRDFIRRVCDQDGGAHVDPKPAAGLASFPNRAEVIMIMAELVCESAKIPPSDIG